MLEGHHLYTFIVLTIQVATANEENGYVDALQKDEQPEAAVTFEDGQKKSENDEDTNDEEGNEEEEQNHNNNNNNNNNNKNNNNNNNVLSWVVCEL